MGYIKELRKVVGSRPLNLAGVAVAVFNKRTNITSTKAEWYLGCPGGFVELGESTEEAGRRSVRRNRD